MGQDHRTWDCCSHSHPALRTDRGRLVFGGAGVTLPSPCPPLHISTFPRASLLCSTPALTQPGVLRRLQSFSVPHPWFHCSQTKTNTPYISLLCTNKPFHKAAASTAKARALLWLHTVKCLFQQAAAWRSLPNTTAATHFCEALEGRYTAWPGLFVSHNLAQPVPVSFAAVFTRFHPHPAPNCKAQKGRDRDPKAELLVLERPAFSTTRLRPEDTSIALHGTFLFQKQSYAFRQFCHWGWQWFSLGGALVLTVSIASWLQGKIPQPAGTDP